MEEDLNPFEKPRFLLPQGCKDLYDVLRLDREQPRGDVEKLIFDFNLDDLAPATDTDTDTDAGSETDPTTATPASIILPNPVSVRELAALLHLPPFVIVSDLMSFDIFISLGDTVEFPVARTLCAQHGVEASLMTE